MSHVSLFLSLSGISLSKKCSQKREVRKKDRKGGIWPYMGGLSIEGGGWNLFYIINTMQLRATTSLNWCSSDLGVMLGTTKPGWEHHWDYSCGPSNHQCKVPSHCATLALNYFNNFFRVYLFSKTANAWNPVTNFVKFSLHLINLTGFWTRICTQNFKLSCGQCYDPSKHDSFLKDDGSTECLEKSGT